MSVSWTISNVNHVNGFHAGHELVCKDVSYNLYTVTCGKNGLPCIEPRNWAKWSRTIMTFLTPVNEL
ncbi:hypothetical protein P692DRAFT_20832941 [Suillus brevipes Sb2]|nr:hypothetical protein P692DRAFT_20832941 [Suillus brevipes Sb2]